MAIGDPAASGFIIIAPGTFAMDIRGSVEVLANNTPFEIRLTTPDGPSTPLPFIGRSNGDHVSFAIKLFANVTQADLDLGTVFLLWEVSSGGGSSLISWDYCEIDIARVGISV